MLFSFQFKTLRSLRGTFLPQIFHLSEKRTSPALQKHFVIFFVYLPGSFALKKGGDFWLFFSGLRLGNEA